MAAGSGIGAFAGGLANGINNAMQFSMQKKYYDGLNDHRERQDDIRQQQVDAKASGKSEKGGDYEGFDASLMPIFKSSGNKPAGGLTQQRSIMAGSGLASPDSSVPMIPDAALSGSAPAAYQAGSLASVSRPQAQPAPPQPEPEEDLSPRQQIVKQMMFGNLANEPDKLNAIAAAAAMHGLGDKITPWIEGLYKAKKSGVFDGAMNLLNNNIDGAIDDLKRGGITLQDRPEKVNPDDPNDHRWKINISGTGERVMDIKNMIGSTMDADKFLKWQNDMNESVGKRNVSDSQVRENDASAEKNKAMAKAYSTGSLGAGRRTGGGGGGLGPTVRKTLETDQGIVAVMSDGTKRILADDNGKPMFGTSGQKIAAGLVGKTLNQFGDNGDIAGKVNSLAGQLQGGKTQPPARINTLPEGAKQIGTSGGKPVYEANGRRFIGE